MKPLGNLWLTTPFRLSENVANALFTIFLAGRPCFEGYFRHYDMNMHLKSELFKPVLLEVLFASWPRQRSNFVVC